MRTNDLSLELDIHFLSQSQLKSDLLAGDDIVQWSLRFGCIVFDEGTVRRALRLMAERQPWPNVERKRSHAAKSLELAHRFVATGDEDGALVQVRTALSLAARARLAQRGGLSSLARGAPGSASRARPRLWSARPCQDDLRLAVSIRAR